MTNLTLFLIYFHCPPFLANIRLVPLEDNMKLPEGIEGKDKIEVEFNKSLQKTSQNITKQNAIKTHTHTQSLSRDLNKRYAVYE